YTFLLKKHHDFLSISSCAFLRTAITKRNISPSAFQIKCLFQMIHNHNFSLTWNCNRTFNLIFDVFIFHYRSKRF
ncbi:hypothetical protein L9F63_011813, partial [Diploptera punctata]